MKTPLSWMAWTWPTAAFFLAIVVLLVMMAVWQKVSPRNAPRAGLLGLPLQRGDRLFLSLLGSSFIHLAWLALSPWPLWGATALSVLYFLAVFRFA
jgi:predicted small integral membrane protein